MRREKDKTLKGLDAALARRGLLVKYDASPVKKARKTKAIREAKAS